MNLSSYRNEATLVRRHSRHFTRLKYGDVTSVAAVARVCRNISQPAHKLAESQKTFALLVPVQLGDEPKLTELAVLVLEGLSTSLKF